MQDSNIRAMMRAGVGMLVVAALALGGAGLWPAQAQQIVPSQTVVLVVASQKVERIEDGAGNDLGPGAVEAAIKVGDGGWAKGQTRVTLADSQIDLSYETGRVIYDEAGQVSRLELSGHGKVTGATGRQAFAFTADVHPEQAWDPDTLVFDILGSNVYDGVRFEVKGKIELESR